jgi:hypothetical protein
MRALPNAGIYCETADGPDRHSSEMWEGAQRTSKPKVASCRPLLHRPSADGILRTDISKLSINRADTRIDMATSDKKMGESHVGAAHAGQFDSLVKLCNEYPRYGLLACRIAERFNPHVSVDSEQATYLVTMLCRRLAENESEALAAVLHQLAKFRDVGALSEFDAAALMSNAYDLKSVRP